MSEPDSSPELREALARVIEGEAEPADEQRVAEALRANPGLGHVLRAQLEMDALLRQQADPLPDQFAEAVAERLAADRTAPAFTARIASAVSRRRPIWGAGWALAAAIAVAATALLWWRVQAPARTLVQLAQVSGLVSWSSDRGDWETGLSDGAQLTGGTLSVEGETSSAMLIFRDGTRVTLTGNAELTFSDDSQKRLRCARGILTASVMPQPRDKPMLVRTATAEIEVLGTVFTIEAEAAVTSVAVQRGAVRVRRIDETRSALIAAEQIAVVDAETEAPITPRQCPSALAQWRASFDTPVDDRWSAAWLPADGADPKRIQAVPLLVGAKQKFLKPGVKVIFETAEGSSAGVAVAPGTVLRVRVRSPEADQINVFICTNTAMGAFSGNFGREIMLRRPTDAAGWQELEIPLVDLEPVEVFREEFPRSDGTRVRFLLLTAHRTFEVASMEIVAR
jgi:ferric-dicitrate binding protein FerR (iron transport regulator)